MSNCIVADASAVNLNGIKATLASGLSTCFIKGKQVFNNGPKSLHKNPSYCLFYASEFLIISY